MIHLEVLYEDLLVFRSRIPKGESSFGSSPECRWICQDPTVPEIALSITYDAALPSLAMRRSKTEAPITLAPNQTATWVAWSARIRESSAFSGTFPTSTSRQRVLLIAIFVLILIGLTTYSAFPDRQPPPDTMTLPLRSSVRFSVPAPLDLYFRVPTDIRLPTLIEIYLRADSKISTVEIDSRQVNLKPRWMGARRFLLTRLPEDRLLHLRITPKTAGDESNPPYLSIDALHALPTDLLTTDCREVEPANPSLAERMGLASTCEALTQSIFWISTLEKLRAEQIVLLRDLDLRRKQADRLSDWSGSRRAVSTAMSLLNDPHDYRWKAMFRRNELLERRIRRKGL